MVNESAGGVPVLKRRVLGGLIVILLFGSGGLCLWMQRTSERLLMARSRRIIDKNKIGHLTEAYWLEAHTLLLVTSDSDKDDLLEPAKWTGKVERLDTQTNLRVRDPALTHLLNNLHIEPMGCEAVPGGKWLLWTVTETMDHYPNPLVSTLDGQRYYIWPANKFDHQYWLNSYQWIDQEHFPYNAEAPNSNPSL